MLLSTLNPYSFIIAASLIIIVSYFFNLLTQRTNIPSVLLLIVLGVLIRQGLTLVGLEELNLFPVLEILGIVGLIMIVLEAALDLKLTRDKWPIIWKSFTVAFLGVMGCMFLLALVIQAFIPSLDFLIAMIYATPLSIMSSAIIIPSVVNLDEDKKEFMIYESTFSDILGIMCFYFILSNIEANSAVEVGVSVVGNILVTIVISFLVSYLMIYAFQKLNDGVKLFLLISVLLTLYSIGKLLHLSSLMIILVFGLILENPHLFIRGFLKKHIKQEQLASVFKDLKVVTIESSFVVRTFFFVIFGITISLSSLLSVRVVIVSFIALVLIYGLRYLLLKVIVRDFKPQVFIAPRGLISILLFFAIPEQYHVEDFESGILLFVIIVTSVIMAWSLIQSKKEKKMDIPSVVPVNNEVGKIG
ncbi:MAG: cation:proton antiporter [Marinifilaceae bacterium]